MSRKRIYDLEDRLLEYASDIIMCVDNLRSTRAARHVGDQLLRAGTSPLFNHGEAESAESAKDFIHKMKVCLKELRESRRALRLILKAHLSKQSESIPELLEETEELIRIFYRSIDTARKRAVREDCETEYGQCSAPLNSMLDVRCSMLDVDPDNAPPEENL